MPCILTAHTTGSLEAVTLNLLQSDIKQLYIDPDYPWYQNLEAEASGLNLIRVKKGNKLPI